MTFPREPDVPALTPDQIAEITRVCFMPHDPTSADVLFIFGTIQGDWDGFASRVLDGTYPRVVTSGHAIDGRPALSSTIAEHLTSRGVSTGLISGQDRSSNTTEDVEFALDLIGPAQTIAFAAKSHHSGRCQRVLRRFYPSAVLKAYCFDAEYGGVYCSRDNWFEDERCRGRVWGEYLRILDYADRGWISREP